MYGHNPSEAKLIKMLTAHPQVINRTVRAGIKATVDEFADALDQAVNVGTNIFASETHPATKGEENLAPTMLFRHFLDLLDSISVLTKSGSADPSKLLLRAAFEVLLNLEYLFEKNTYERSMAYLFCDVVKQIKFFEKFDPGSEGGKTFKAAMENSKNVGEIKSGNTVGLRQEINRKWAMLREPRYAVAFQKYKSFKKKDQNRAPWYQYDSSISNIEQLASHLNRSGMYELYYRKWSGAMHGTDLYLGKIDPVAEVGVGIAGIRFPKDLQEVTIIALTFSLLIFDLYVTKREPLMQPEFDIWKATVAANLKILNSGPRIIFHY